MKKVIKKQVKKVEVKSVKKFELTNVCKNTFLGKVFQIKALIDITKYDVNCFSFHIRQ